MPVQEPSAPAPPPPSTIPAQERTPSLPPSPGDAPTINPPRGKKTASKKKTAPKGKATEKAKLATPVDAPTSQRVRYRYEPYRKADPTPEPEADLPADPEELETLDATAKTLYKSDREVLEYIESLKRRTSAMLEHVNRTDSQLRSCKGSMERIQSFVAQWKKMGDQWTHEDLLGIGNLEAKWVDGRTEMLDLDESDEEDNAPNPDLFPTLTRGQNGAFPTTEEHLHRNIHHPEFPSDYARDILGEYASRSFTNDEEEDLVRPETPPARQPSLPPGHEDENGLEYAEDDMEIRSDLPAPPDHAALASDDSTFDRSGVDLRITSDTGVLRPPSDEEVARISREFKREAMDFAATLAVRPPTNPSRLRHPLAESYVPSSPELGPQPEPQRLVVPHPIPRTPSPSRTVLAGKRKRIYTPAENEEHKDTGKATHPGASATDQVEAANNEDKDRGSSKRRRLIARQPTWDFEMFAEAGLVPDPPRADPPTRGNSPDPSSEPVHKQASPADTSASQIHKEDSELEKSQVLEMLSQVVEQGESEDEESTGNILGGLSGSQHSLPTLTADNTRATSIVNTQSELETPAESQAPAEVLAAVPEDVFGPIVLSAKADDISEVVEKDADGDVAMSGSGNEAGKLSSRSARFSVDGIAEKEEYKVFRKTPMRPRTSSRVTQAENALATEVEAESQDVLKPLSSPKKKRAIGARVRKPKSSIEAEHTTNHENGLPSISASKPPSRARRGRSASVQPEAPALPKTPARKSTRTRK